jgi:hypothetical protein
MDTSTLFPGQATSGEADTMTIEQFRTALRTAPFRPFTIRLADGSKVAVRHPEMVAVHPTGRTTVVIQPNGGWSVLDLLLVTALDFSEPGESTGTEPPEKLAG